MTAQTSPFWGMATSSSHQVGIATCLAHHATQAEVGLKGCVVVVSSSASGVGASSSRKLSNWGSREGGCLKFPASGWDQSNGSPTLSGSSGQDCRGESLAAIRGMSSSKVTLLFGQVGLGDGAHLLPNSSWWPAGKGISSYAFYFWNTLYSLTAGKCLATLGSSDVHERWSNWATLCAFPALLLWPVPASEHPSLPIGPPSGNPAADPATDQSGHMLHASGC